MITKIMEALFGNHHKAAYHGIFECLKLVNLLLTRAVVTSVITFGDKHVIMIQLEVENWK